VTKAVTALLRQQTESDRNVINFAEVFHNTDALRCRRHTLRSVEANSAFAIRMFGEILLS
jgi:hypothetical protein